MKIILMMLTSFMASAQYCSLYVTPLGEANRAIMQDQYVSMLTEKGFFIETKKQEAMFVIDIESVIDHEGKAYIETGLEASLYSLGVEEGTKYYSTEGNDLAEWMTSLIGALPNCDELADIHTEY